MVEDLDYTFVPDMEPSEEHNMEKEEQDDIISYSPFPQSSFLYSSKIANSFGSKYNNLTNIKEQKEEEQTITFYL